MIIGVNFLAQVDSDIFKACKEGTMKSVTVPALGKCLFRGDFLTLQDKVSGITANYEVVSHPVAKKAEDEKTILSYTCEINPILPFEKEAKH